MRGGACDDGMEASVMVRATTRWEDDVLSPHLEACLVRWVGFAGPEPSLRTRQDWAEAWRRWGGTVLSKWVRAFPGTRPAAMYAAGLVKAVPLVRPLPMGSRCRGYFVADEGGGVTHWRLSERYQRCEASWLLEQGVIDRAEYRRHLRSGFGHAWRCL